jgi:preprotein translocase subunit SecA
VASTHCLSSARLLCCRYGQRDPLTEYKLEGFELFKDMLARVRRNVIYNVYVFTPTRLSPSEGAAAEGGSGGSGAADTSSNGGAQGKKSGSRKKAAAAAES